MDAATLRGQNMNNVKEPRGVDTLRCQDTRDDMMFASRHVGHARVCGPEPQRSARVLEMFLKSLLTKTSLITESKQSSMVSVAHMKQCIESEMPFHFLKDLAQQAAFTTTQKDNRGLSVWPMYRAQRPDVHVQKTAEMDENAPQQSLDSLGNDSSSSC
ncbi:uncharacterized protein LOC129192909 isoform X2 [Dunckerocampus dactyliophorus]|uniref:uncharacterized protein LOC129192909 isoform X2 n=1 Tax=Dunckerocampus dactyliophorus TaxID=161453 RepID=UPI0024063F19|nr:uncharacterized protein LOC129192909 isoform X2 [Dunckerocampus dactyliophorus]